MDEVEAALDDVNLHRFLDLVHEFRHEAQLIIVSHQKRTMEAADMPLRRHDAAWRVEQGRQREGRSHHLSDGYQQQPVDAGLTDM